MALTSHQITAVLDEVAPVLTGGWIQKIHQPTPRTILLEVRTPGHTHRLLISCLPQIARLHLSTAVMQNPPSPPPFCQFLRACFQGARIDAITQIQADRMVRFDLTTKAGPRALVAELTGKTANLLVLDNADHVIRDLNESMDLTGQAYYPPAPSSQEPKTDRLLSSAPDMPDIPFPLSTAIEALYRDRDATTKLEEARTTRIRALTKSIKKLQRRIEAWQGDLAKATRYRDYARYGELLKANLGRIKKGVTEIGVVDYFETMLSTLTIPLDSTKTPRGNMEDYFSKHRKYQTAERELCPRIEAGLVELAALRHEVDSIKQGSWRPPAVLPSASPTQHDPAGNRKSILAQKRQGPFRRFVSSDGIPIFVGRNARENEQLTFHVAKSDDVWLHVRGTAGSHVVVRLAKGQDIPPETLRDAATLALCYSDLKKSGKGDVIYTKRKWVKKAKGQATGAVTVTQDQSCFVSLDRTRLEGLKARSD